MSESNPLVSARELEQMNDWMAEAERHALARAPRMTAEHAHHLADDLYRAWPDLEPADAVAKFFGFMPQGWKTSQFAEQQQAN